MPPLPDNAPRHEWLQLAQDLLNSYRRWTGADLFPRGSVEDDLERLWSLSQVVVSHGTQADPAFVFGNRLALELWEMPLEDFLGMPSRLTAEPMHRDDRQRLLDATREHGFFDNYCGVRITRTGRRFQIEKALLWMVLDGQGDVIGQAATFDSWTWLPG